MNEWIPVKTISAVPLNALRAFEVTARHMSMKQAAAELNVTPSAISHRLRLLEKILGCRLLRRHGSQLTLTEYGQALAPALTEGFDCIIGALDDLRRPQRRVNEQAERTDHVETYRDCGISHAGTQRRG